MTAPQPGLAARLGPVGIAAIVTGVLILFGIGAVIVPALTDGGPATSNAQPASPETTAEQTGEALPGSPAQSASPSRNPSSAAPALVSANFNTNYEERVVQLVNNERRKEKCEPVRMNAQLRGAARAHSADMAANNLTGSTGSDGSGPQDRVQKAGYSAFADELTARGGDASDVVKGWLRDGDDRDVLVDCGIRSIGVGAAMRGRTAYWTVDTGRA